MNPKMQAILSKVIGVACAVMMVTSLSVIAVQRADHRPGTQVAAQGSNSGGGGTTAGDAGSPSGGTDASGASASGPSSSGGGAAAGGGTAAASKPGSGPAAAKGAGPAAQAQTGGQCKDYNPDQGVFCDHNITGGTTVLSGPLAVYGEGGLKGGQAWLTYYNKVLAPQLHLRQIKLIYYDDSDDPNKCLQFTQRMVEVDHITYLAGVTSPGAIK